MSLPVFGSLGPMNIQGRRKFEMAYPLCGSCSSDANPHDEVLVRHVLDRGKHVLSHIRKDNQPATDYWGADRNPEVGQVLKTTVGPATGLQSGVVDMALSLKFDPQTQRPECSRMESANGNFSSRLEWDGGELSSVREKRVLADGRTETLNLLIDKEKGIISYDQDVE